jgi:plastocyanin
MTRKSIELPFTPEDVASGKARREFVPDIRTMKGTPSLVEHDGVRKPDGHREYTIVLHRGKELIDVAMIFAPAGETFDPGDVVSFSRDDTPDHEEPILVGDVLTLTFSMLK